MGGWGFWNFTPQVGCCISSPFAIGHFFFQYNTGQMFPNAEDKTGSMPLFATAIAQLLFIRDLRSLLRIIWVKSIKYPKYTFVHLLHFLHKYSFLHKEYNLLDDICLLWTFTTVFITCYNLAIYKNPPTTPLSLFVCLFWAYVAYFCFSVCFGPRTDK